MVAVLRAWVVNDERGMTGVRRPLLGRRFGGECVDPRGVSIAVGW